MTVTMNNKVYTVTAATHNGTTVDPGAIVTGSTIESISSGSAGASATSSSGSAGKAGHAANLVPSLALYAGLFILTASIWS